MIIAIDFYMQTALRGRFHVRGMSGLAAFRKWTAGRGAAGCHPKPVLQETVIQAFAKRLDTAPRQASAMTPCMSCTYRKLPFPGA
jgi:hypothetical protein